jgi:hypothetical protein
MIGTLLRVGGMMLRGLGRATGNGRFNKAWVAVGAPALIAASEILLDIRLAAEFNRLLVVVLTGGSVWAVPNRS